MITPTGRPLAVVVGFIGKAPVAGMALYNLHYLLGLEELGYDVHYVERLNRPDECYDPQADEFTDDPRYALGWLHRVLFRFGFDRSRFSFVDRTGRCHGSGWPGLTDALDRADFVLTVADPTWFDELECCPRRAFVDGDPLFTQVALLRSDPLVTEALAHYPTCFSYGTRIGLPDCSVPDVGRIWLPTRPVVATELWRPSTPDGVRPVTTVMNWGAWEDVKHDGRLYGHKGREFAAFADLPGRSAHRFLLAAGGPAPKEDLRRGGWGLVDPIAVTQTIDAYVKFIDGSYADFGLAKHAYVASRSGWFSDRSTCYLASGRPVLHQDTGFTDWLPEGEGVLAFSDLDDLLDALDRLDADYERHARAARRIAEEHFEARTVVGRMLDEAGFR